MRGTSISTAIGAEEWREGGMQRKECLIKFLLRRLLDVEMRHNIGIGELIQESLATRKETIKAASKDVAICYQ